MARRHRTSLDEQLSGPPSLPPPPVPVSNSWGAPVKWQPAAAAAAVYEHKVLWRRLLAYLVDSTILLLPVWAVRVGLHVISITLSNPAITLATAPVDLVYFGWFWTRPGGATPGMRLLRIGMVASPGGSLVTLPAAAIRVVILQFVLDGIYMAGDLLPAAKDKSAVLGFVVLAWWLILIGTALASPRRQSVHDRLARTVVVEHGRASFGRLLAAAAIFVGGYGALIWLTLGPLKGI